MEEVEAMWKEWKLCGRRGKLCGRRGKLCGRGGTYVEELEAIYVEGLGSYVVEEGIYVEEVEELEEVEAMWKTWKPRGRRWKQ